MASAGDPPGVYGDWAKTHHLATNPAFGCLRCGSPNSSYREWESADGAHEDVEYRCDDRGKTWWVEGIDA